MISPVEHENRLNQTAQAARPYVWTKTADQILASIANYCTRIDLATLAAAETFRSRPPNIPVRILTADPAMHYARQPLSKDFLRCRAADLNLHTPEWLAPRRRAPGSRDDHVSVRWLGPTVS